MIVLQDEELVGDWTTARKEMGFAKDEEVARFLLSSYRHNGGGDTKSGLHCRKCRCLLTFNCPKYLSSSNTEVMPDAELLPPSQETTASPPSLLVVGVKLENEKSPLNSGVNMGTLDGNLDEDSELPLLFVGDENTDNTSLQNDVENKVGSNGPAELQTPQQKPSPLSGKRRSSEKKTRKTKVEMDGFETDDSETTGDKQKAGYFCQYCSKDVGSTKHEFYEHSKIHKDLIVTEKDLDKGQFPCHVCRKVLPTFHGLCVHIGLRSDDRVCSICNKVLVSSCELRPHKRSHTQYCQWCNVTMAELTKDQFRKHLNTQHKKEREEALEIRKEKNRLKRKDRFKVKKMCPICGKFVKAGAMLNHKRTHSDERNFPCTFPGCNSTFKTKNTLNLHMTFHGEKNLVCSVCGKKFQCPTSLCIHKKSVHEAKKFECELCHRKYTQNSTLKIHIQMIHFGVKYSCDICGAKFVRKNYRDRHVLTRHEGKGHTCDQCGVSFIQPHTLQKHIVRCHTDGAGYKTRRYCCEDCPVSFSNLSDLIKHRQSEHSDSLYSCLACDLNFTTSTQFNYHLRMYHSEIMVDSNAVEAVRMKRSFDTADIMLPSDEQPGKQESGVSDERCDVHSSELESNEQSRAFAFLKQSPVSYEVGKYM